MPPPLNVDKEAVRTLVVALGVREAARQLKLSENTLLTWSNKGKWLAPTKSTPALLPLPVSQQPSTIATIKPADSLANVLSDLGNKTKLNLAKASHKASETFADASGPAVIKQAQAFRHITAASSQIHTWEAKQASSGSLSLHILANQSAVQINAGTVPVQEQEQE